MSRRSKSGFSHAKCGQQPKTITHTASHTYQSAKYEWRKKKNKPEKAKKEQLQGTRGNSEREKQSIDEQHTTWGFAPRHTGSR